MSTALRLLGVSASHTTLDPTTRRDVVRAESVGVLRLATPAGSMREVELTEDDLVAHLERVAATLVIVRRVNRQKADQ